MAEIVALKKAIDMACTPKHALIAFQILNTMVIGKFMHLCDKSKKKGGLNILHSLLFADLSMVKLIA